MLDKVRHVSFLQDLSEPIICPCALWCCVGGAREQECEGVREVSHALAMRGSAEHLSLSRTVPGAQGPQLGETSLEPSHSTCVVADQKPRAGFFRLPFSALPCSNTLMGQCPGCHGEAAVKMTQTSAPDDTTGWGLCSASEFCPRGFRRHLRTWES